MTNYIYSHHALPYLKKGYSPLPLPERAKTPPPHGYTGKFDAQTFAPMATEDEVKQWCVDHPDGNIALRLPPGVMALDVDQAGGKSGVESMRRAIANLGPIPMVGRSSAVTDPGHGHYLFRVPEDVEFIGNLDGLYGPHVDIIWHGYRYLVAPPSIHPQHETEYRWIPKNGGDVTEFPSIDELPELPTTWVEALTKRTPTASDVEGVPGGDTSQYDAMDAASKAAVDEYLSTELGRIYGQLEDMKGWGPSDTNEDGGWEQNTLLRTARLARLVNSPWNPLTPEQVIADLKEHLPRDGDFTIPQSIGKFVRALSKPDGAEMPDDLAAAMLMAAIPSAPTASPQADAAEGLPEVAPSADDDKRWPAESWDAEGNIRRALRLIKGRMLWIESEQCWYELEPATGLWRRRADSPSIDDPAAAWCHRAIEAAMVHERDNYDTTPEMDSKGRVKEGSSRQEKFLKYLGNLGAGAHVAIASSLRRRAHDFGLAGHIEDFDTEPYHLATIHRQVIDMRDGSVMDIAEAEEKGYRFTKASPIKYDPEAKAPNFEGYLRHVQPDDDVRDYLQRALGYSCTGETGEEAVFLHYGETAQNGKSTMLAIMLGVLGDDHARPANVKGILHQRSNENLDQHLVDMVGARFLSLSEPPEGATFNESRVKSIASGEAVQARALYRSNSTIRITGKIHVASNYEIRLGGDTGMQRRIHLIQWTQRIPDGNRIGRFAERLLESEGPGILTWLVRGASRWYEASGESGFAVLDQPAVLKMATDDYIHRDDDVARWVRENCDLQTEMDQKDMTPAQDLYLHFRAWLERQGIRSPMTQRAWTSRLKRVPGIERGLVGRQRVAGYNLRLRADVMTPFD